MSNKHLDLILKRKGMPIFLAGNVNKVIFDYITENNYLKLHSYLREKTWVEKFFKQGHKFFIDSGAFTFVQMKKGLCKAPTYIQNMTEEQYIENYIQWINKWEDNIIFAAQLDSIPQDTSKEEVQRSADKTWENYQFMIKKVNNPDIILPVYHFGEDVSNLHRFIDFGCKYIAIGGMANKSQPKRREFCNMLFEEIKKSSNPNVMTHAFGMTSYKILEEFPFTSCDSTSWTVAPNFGSVKSPWGVLFTSPKKIHDPLHILNQDLDVIEEFEEHIAEMGLTLKLLEDYKYRQIYAIHHMMKWAENYKYKGKY